MTQERATALSTFLTSDEKRAKDLLALEPNEALTQINAYGHDFTLDEIIEFGKAVNTAAKANDELSTDALDEAAGGVAGAVVVAAAVLAYAIGKDCGAAGW